MSLEATPPSKSPVPQHTRRLSRAVFWAATGQYGKQVLAFGFMIVIARILSPQDYGLVAMIGFFAGFARVFIDSGFSMTLIRENEDALLYDTVFWTNLALSSSVAALLFSSADLISRFYGEPRLVELVHISAALMVVESLSIVQRARLRKRLQFGTLAIIENVSLVLGSSVCLAMAWHGAGYWSLVGQQIAVTLSDACLFFLMGFKPRLRFSYAALRPLLPFSLGLLGNKSANTLLDNIDELLVGKMGGPELLGLYNRGNSLMQVPIRSTTFIFARVLYSGFASIQHDKAASLHLFSRLTSLYAFLMPPIMLFLGLNAEPIVTVLLGDKWIGAAKFLSAFCLVGAIHPLVGPEQERDSRSGLLRLRVQVGVAGQRCRRSPHARSVCLCRARRSHPCKGGFDGSSIFRVLAQDREFTRPAREQLPSRMAALVERGARRTPRICATTLS